MAAKKKAGKRRMLLLLSIFAVLLPVGFSFSHPVINTSNLSDTPAALFITSSPVPTITQAPSATSSPTVQISPTVTVPPVSESNRSSILLSIMHDSFYQLYIFDPVSSAFTQLTDQTWNIITPALSPDGNYLAFCSNRDGYWDLFMLDLSNYTLTKLTNTPQYDAAPTWSPDGKWLAYETYLQNNLEIQIISTVPGDTTSLQLTEDPSADFSPAWSPDGQYLLFVSNRTGDDEIWMADLHTTQDRFTNMSNDSSADDRDPIWSSDGNYSLWSSIENGTSNIIRKPVTNDGTEIVITGSQPRHNPNGTEIMLISESPFDSLISTYSTQTKKISDVPAILPGVIDGATWIPDAILTRWIDCIQKMDGVIPLTDSEPNLAESGQPDDEYDSLTSLDGINVPNAYLVSNVIDDFYKLKQKVEQSIGWNYMDNLENAFLPITEPPSPDMSDSWLYTGRAIAINTSPLYGGWMCIAREDFNGQTYWRVFLKTRFQDGSQGMPLKSMVWDFTTRSSGDPTGYENGGTLSDIPEGYWIDFTALAQQYGWHRSAALQNWRSYIDGALVNEYVHDDDLTWQAAMLELYPPEALVTATRFPTTSPTPQVLQTPQ